MSSMRLLRISVVFIAAAALTFGSLGVVAPQAIAGSPTCFVRNLATHHLYRGTGPILQKAVDTADPGTTLAIRGICVGNFHIDKDLKLVGIATAADPVPTLDGDAAGTVLTVNASTVELKDLTITNGLLTGTEIGSPGSDGAGIYNEQGDVTLSGSTNVTANTGRYAAGILNDAGFITLMGRSQVSGNSGDGIWNFVVNPDYGVQSPTTTLNGASRVSGNTGRGIHNYGAIVMNGRSLITGNGGGIDNAYDNGCECYIPSGSVTMNDYSRVSGNTGVYGGGGIANWEGGIHLNGHARVSGNSANEGGGIWDWVGGIYLNDSARITGNSSTDGSGGGIFTDQGYVQMNGASRIDHNSATDVGGGIWSSYARLIGTVAGANVTLNTPDDIHAVP